MQNISESNNHPDYKPLLNKRARRKLFQDGKGELAFGLNDMFDVRRFAYWCKESDAEVNLFILLLAASRLVARQHLEASDTDPGHRGVQIKAMKNKTPQLEKTCQIFLECYPQEKLHASQRGLSKDIVNHVCIELFVLHALLENPAVNFLRHLFDDSELTRQVNYRDLLEKIDTCLVSGQNSARHGSSLARLLRAPMHAAPDSLVEQVNFIKQNWSQWLPVNLLEKIQVAKALYEEENTVRMPGPGPALMPNFGEDEGSNAPAAFTDDTDWMANSIILAKSVYVWLDQLGNRYQRSISTLADIPEEELAVLSRQGFNALWLIGIWERSRASRKIKQLAGNPEAEASAYALYAYRVAAELGGEEALAVLQARCQQHGIRLACDVVPNHTGIDSEWLIEHPDWFIQCTQPPYPAYRFNGPDLCEHESVSIRIEDGYWDHSDAAVVCEYLDHTSGRRRYIYHGNDGTHMPWNDTAQLNFLLPDVRNAMSDLIVAVAKKFSLIRFDAAMTLARKHFRRLWFPPPGGGAGVPSRSEFWMSDEDFSRAFPVEFWREVVDRINREAPDTLLIAEAFWLMESYFVRTLGMHRVYNSAFMNMLKKEDNANYRKILKDTLAYNPEILKRYVNFMNNPDEATAVEQFGKGDKYFGVATLLVTLPGLPMFGHGQVEGYREKYGMEYRRAYWQEQPDEGFMAHHDKQIFPLLQKRHVFSGVENFSFYDFMTEQGVCEDVYCFSNGAVDRKHLVVYNNAPHPVKGWIHHAAPKALPQREGVARPMPQLWQEFELDQDNSSFCRFRNLQGEEYLLPISRLKNGLELHLEGYQHQVFCDFRTLEDQDGLWQVLYNQKKNQPMQNLDRERQRLQYRDIWTAFVKLMDLQRLHVLAGMLSASPAPKPAIKLKQELLADLDSFLVSVEKCGLTKGNVTKRKGLGSILERLPDWLTGLSRDEMPNRLLAEIWSGHRNHPGSGAVILAWLILDNVCSRGGIENQHEWLPFIQEIGLDFVWHEQAMSNEQHGQVTLSLLLLQTIEPGPATDEEAFTALCTDEANSRILGTNDHAGGRWFNREGMIAMAGAIALQAGIRAMLASQSVTDSDQTEKIAEKLRQRLARATAVGYRLDKFIALR